MRHTTINDSFVLIGYFPTTTLLKAVDTTSSSLYPQFCSAYTDDNAEYYLDRTSSATESLPNIVAPTTGTGRWILKTGVEAGVNPQNLIKLLLDPANNKSMMQFVHPTADYTTSQQEGGIPLFTADKQLVTLPTGYDYTHGSCIAHEYLFLGCRVPSGQPGRVMRLSLKDLSSQTGLIFPDATYNAAEQLTYVASKDLIYIAHNNNGGNDLHVTALNPLTMAYTSVITDLGLGYKVYYPTTASDGTYLYVISGQQTVGTTLKIRKYRLSDYSFVSELDTGIVAGGHSAKFDGQGSMFVTTAYRTVAVQQYVLRIDLSTFTLVDQGALTGESYTDDMAIAGDYVYCGMEYIFNPVDTLTISRANKHNLSTIDLITIPTVKGSCYGMFYDDNYLWCCAATSPGIMIRINPETLIADLYTLPTGEEIPNEYLYNPKTGNHFFTYWKQPAAVARYNKLQYQQTVVLRVNEGIVSDLRLAPESITKSALSTLITGNALIPNKQYSISDSTNGDKIIVTASSVSKLKNDSIWLKTTNVKSFGWLTILAGTSGSVDSLYVNGVNQMTSSVTYATSLSNTASLVAANINANGAATWTAIGMNNVIVLISKTAGTAYNGLSVTGLSTNLTLGGTQNTVRGMDPVIYPLEIKYDLASDIIMSCYDPILNNRIQCSKSYITYANGTLGAAPILDFRWGDPAFIDTSVKKGYIKDVYIAGDGLFEANTLEDFSFIRNIIGTSSSYFGINSCYGAEAVIRNNTMTGTFTQIIRNEVRGPITNNMLSGSQSKISTNTITVKSDSSYVISGITGNTLSGSIAVIAYNILNASNVSSAHCKISNNILSASNAVIWDNILLGEGSYIDSNTISISNGRIRKNKLMGSQSGIYNNVISGGTSSGIYDCYLNGFSSYIGNNTLINPTGTAQGIIQCVLNGYNTNINGCTVDNGGFIGNIILDAVNASLLSFTTTTLIPRVENMHWMENNTIRVVFLKTGLNGTTNNGLSGSPIYFGIIPVAKAYPKSATIEGNGLTGTSSLLRFGFETDDNQNLLIDTAYSALNTPYAGIITMSKSTIANRAVIATPSNANVATGSIQIVADYIVSSF